MLSRLPPTPFDFGSVLVRVSPDFVTSTLSVLNDIEKFGADMISLRMGLILSVPLTKDILVIKAASGAYMAAESSASRLPNA